jgi:hypothetical protein
VRLRAAYFREQVGIPIRRYLLWDRYLTAMSHTPSPHCAAPRLPRAVADGPADAFARPTALASVSLPNAHRDTVSGAMGRGTRLCCEPGLVQLCQEPVYLGRDEVADCANGCEGLAGGVR